MLVYPENRKAYLKSKPMAYQTGWLACENNLENKTINVTVTDSVFFDKENKRLNA